MTRELYETGEGLNSLAAVVTRLLTSRDSLAREATVGLLDSHVTISRKIKALVAERGWFSIIVAREDFGLSKVELEIIRGTVKYVGAVANAFLHVLSTEEDSNSSL